VREDDGMLSSAHLSFLCNRRAPLRFQLISFHSKKDVIASTVAKTKATTPVDFDPQSSKLIKAILYIMAPKLISALEQRDMTEQAKLGGAFTLPGTSMSLNRMGYGAMQLAGPQVWGPPRDVDAAIAVLREAIATGVNHIDTSDYYGPHVTNQIIKQAKTSTTWHTAMTMPSSMRSFSKA